MALTKGINCGFVEVAPDGDPEEVGMMIDAQSQALKDTVPAGAKKVTQIGWYCSTESEEINYEVAIYDHNVGDNNPEAVDGIDQTNAKGTTTGWKRCMGLDIEVTPETIRWITVQVDATVADTKIDRAVDAGEKLDLKSAQTELTDPWGVSDDTLGQLAAIYAVYEKEVTAEEHKFGSIQKDSDLGPKGPGIYP